MSNEGTYSDEYVESLFENLKYTTAVCAVLLQNEGGAVEIEQDVLEKIDLSKTFINIKVEDGKYIVEGVFDE